VAAGGEARELLEESQGFLDFFQKDTLIHFREEEEIVFPLAIEDERATELLSRVVTEHLQIHALVAQLALEVQEDRIDRGTALRLAEALEAHIRLEEGEVFPLLEQVVSDDQLRRITFKPRNRVPA
jgi:iron-sulfur cluster repair protein YtfE (RIC family)